jgi:pilus assembly protein CpaB
MKAKKNSVGILVAVLLILVGGGLVWNSTRSSSSQAEETEVATDTVVVVVAPITAGTPVKDFMTGLDVQDVPVDQIAEGTLRNLDELALLSEDGYAAVADIPAGTQLSRALLFLPGEREVTAIEVPTNLFTVTVAVESQRALGGQISDGDEVAVLATFDADDNDPSGTRVILERVLVAGLRSESVFTPEQREDNLLTVEQAIGGRMYVTLAVPVADLEKLIYAVENGRIWLARQNEDATIDGSEIRTRDTVIGSEPGDATEDAAAEGGEGGGEG